jgi:lysophospholipase L1-like esterase
MLSAMRAKSFPKAVLTFGAGLAAATAPLLSGCSGPSSPDPARAASYSSGLASIRAAVTRPGRGPVYYLALGDSLSRGIQPGPGGSDVMSGRGYADRLAARLRHRVHGLRLVELGCSGETTTTMIHGGICGYQAGSQLAQAVTFLRSHRDKIALVTIDIGANDPNSCVLGVRTSAILGCLWSRVPHIVSNLDVIMGELRSAAGPRVLIVGMTYYVPELGLWHTGRNGKIVAVLTEGFAAGVNKQLTIRYHRYGALVANVFGAFRSNDFANAIAGPGRFRHTAKLPPNVARICALTWMCSTGPRGPNEHANNAGYRLIARTFWHAISG